MRRLSLVMLAAALGGCETPSTENLGGFALYPAPELSGSPSYYCGEGTLGLGFASDGALWLVYSTGSDTGRTWPATFDGTRWQIGSPYASLSMEFLGMHPEGPALGSSAKAVRYSAGGWRTQAAPQPFLSPDGRLYSLWEDLAGDLHVSVYSPGWDAVAVDAVVLTAAERPDHRSGLLAFSPSGEAIFEYQVSGTVLGFRRWDGSAWVQASTDLELGAYGGLTAFQVDARGRSWVMPGEAPTKTWHWTGSAWKELGPVAQLTRGTDGDGQPPYTQLVAKVDAQDRLVVAWAAWTLSSRDATISVRRYGSAGWEDLGPPIQTTAYVYAPALALAPDGTPVVAWISVDRAGPWSDSDFGEARLKVARYTGAGTP